MVTHNSPSTHTLKTKTLNPKAFKYTTCVGCSVAIWNIGIQIQRHYFN